MTRPSGSWVDVVTLVGGWPHFWQRTYPNAWFFAVAMETPRPQSHARSGTQ